MSDLGYDSKHKATQVKNIMLCYFQNFVLLLCEVYFFVKCNQLGMILAVRFLHFWWGGWAIHVSCCLNYTSISYMHFVCYPWSLARLQIWKTAAGVTSTETSMIWYCRTIYCPSCCTLLSGLFALLFSNDIFYASWSWFCRNSPLFAHVLSHVEFRFW